MWLVILFGYVLGIPFLLLRAFYIYIGIAPLFLYGAVFLLTGLFKRPITFGRVGGRLRGWPAAVMIILLACMLGGMAILSEVFLPSHLSIWLWLAPVVYGAMVGVALNYSYKKATAS